MPDRYPTNTANRDRDTTPARALRQAAFPTGVFRCDRCDRVVPDALLVEQDGYSLCRTLCADERSVSEDNIRLAEQLAQVDAYAPNADPPSGPFAGLEVVTSHTALPVTLPRQAGYNVAVVLAGVNFTSATTLSYESADITDASAPAITSTSITLSLNAENATPGYYDLTIGEAVYRDALLVVAVLP